MKRDMELTIASQRLGLSYNQIHRLVLTGRLPGEKVGGRWRVDADAVDRFAKSRREKERE